MKPPTPPNPQPFPILVAASRRQILIDGIVRALLMAATAILIFNLRNPLTGHVFWPILIAIELLILTPFVLTIFIRWKQPNTKPLTPDQIKSSNQTIRAINARGVIVAIVACSVTYFVTISQQIWLLPYTMTLPLLLFIIPPRPSRKTDDPHHTVFNASASNVTLPHYQRNQLFEVQSGGEPLLGKKLYRQEYIISSVARKN